MPAETASAPMSASDSAPESTKHLPDTATPLPILALLGLGLLATGLLSRRSRSY
jgi:LPXTG-motif cell wall-anchored protein